MPSAHLPLKPLPAARLLRALCGLCLVGLLAAACGPITTAPTTSPAAVHLTILVDGDVEAYEFAPGLTVREAVATAGITLGDLDQLNPPPFTVISEGLAIVITRVTE